MSNSRVPQADLQDALQKWDFGGPVLEAEPYGEGHINDTFCVVAQGAQGNKRFIMQRINTTIFTDPAGLMQNITGVTQYLRERIIEAGGNPDRETLTVVYTKDNEPFYQSSTTGSCWRVYIFVEETVTYQQAETPELFAASARAFGNFARQLEDYPAATLHETIPFFHDTRVRFKNLQKAIEADAKGRAAQCKDEIEFALAREKDCAVLMDLLDAGELPLRVTHNDTKLNNVLLDDKTGEGVCVIDLDTVMPGLSLHDYGDSIRFGASTATEDETDLDKVQLSIPLFSIYTKDYLKTAGPAMTAKEKEMLPWGAKLMTLECGMRFLTDYLEGDTYFKIHRPEHNLDRCRTQFKLVQEMENKWDELNHIVKEAMA